MSFRRFFPKICNLTPPPYPLQLGTKEYILCSAQGCLGTTMHKICRISTFSKTYNIPTHFVRNLMLIKNIKGLIEEKGTPK